MKSHKMILKVTYSVVGLSIIVLIVLMIYQRQQISRMSKTESPGISENKPSAEVPGNAGAIKTTPRNADRGIDEPNPPRDITGETPASESDHRAEITGNTNARDSSYAALFKELTLPAEKQDALKTLLVNLQTQKTNLSMEMLDTSIPEEQRVEIEKHLESFENESNEKIKKILGADGFKKYLTYTERLRERTLLTAFFRSISADEKLTGPQEQAFIDAMFEERKQVEAASSLHDNKIESPADLELQISHVMETTDKTYSGYVKVAGMYLSPPRVEQFKNYLHQRRDMVKTSLNTMRQIFGSEPVPKKPPENPDSDTN